MNRLSKNYQQLIYDTRIRGERTKLANSVIRAALSLDGMSRIASRYCRLSACTICCVLNRSYHSLVRSGFRLKRIPVLSKQTSFFRSALAKVMIT